MLRETSAPSGRFHVRTGSAVTVLVLATAAVGAAGAFASSSPRVHRASRPGAVPTVPTVGAGGAAEVAFTWPLDLGAAEIVQAGAWVWDHTRGAGRWATTRAVDAGGGALSFALRRTGDAFPSGHRFTFRLWVRYRHEGRLRSRLSEIPLTWFAP
jgi:hypothetical protein